MTDQTAPHREIPLTQGKVALVDEADYEALARFKWYVSVTRGTIYYARRWSWVNGVRHNVNMHRVLLDPPAGLTVDHINGDGLDNRRCNLRVATPQQQQFNKRTRRGSSWFYGVSKSRANPKWEAQIVIDGRRTYIGSFSDEVEAARAYDAVALAHRGEFAVLNFPVEAGS